MSVCSKPCFGWPLVPAVDGGLEFCWALLASDLGLTHRGLGAPLKGSIRDPLKGSIRVPLKGSIRDPLKGSIRVPLKGSIRDLWEV